MSEQEIIQKLEKLASWQEEHLAAVNKMQADIDEAIGSVAKARLAQIDADFTPIRDAFVKNICAIEDEIKQDVIRLGSSVKGTYLHAVWNKGRITWDTKSLDGYATAHPELLPFRKEGEPSVSIRSAK